MTKETTIKEESKQQFGIKKIYIKKSSFEGFGTPDVFKNEWKPEAKFEIKMTPKKLKEESYEIILDVSITISKESETVCIIEVRQAGIFVIKGYEEKQLDHLLKSYCPTVLFPYLRETISEQMIRGGFPEFYVAPINFDAIYAEQQKQEAKKTETKEVLH
jgi:preprotein translocase subunit SecB